MKISASQPPVHSAFNAVVANWHWLLASVLVLFIGVDSFSSGLNTPSITALFAAAILIAGIPHGTLDVEIIAHNMGRRDLGAKLQYTLIYISCAAVMAGLWAIYPAFALVAFLAMSIVHFGRDWRLEEEPFLGFMVGSALITLPALSHNSEVAALFNIITGSRAGHAIADGLACISLPSMLASLVFCLVAGRQRRLDIVISVAVCIAAAITLPPLAAFAIFFCGLHSPRHFKHALEEAGDISATQKIVVICAVTALSLAMGTGIFIKSGALPIDQGIIQAAFISLSILTLPHFLLEQLLPRFSDQNAGDAHIEIIG